MDRFSDSMQAPKQVKKLIIPRINPDTFLVYQSVNYKKTILLRKIPFELNILLSNDKGFFSV